jgi:hypothetical protein
MVLPPPDTGEEGKLDREKDPGGRERQPGEESQDALQ